MRLLEMTLFAVDIAEMRQFYCAFLGFRELEADWNGRLVVQVGATRLQFEPGEPGWHGRYHFAFDVPPSRFEAAVRWLQERRALLADTGGKSHFHSNSWNADMVYFTDPQGNILELIARHEKQQTGPGGVGSFSASEILCVSEIGLATNDVTGAVAELQTRMPGIGLYQPVQDGMFAAVGDPDGLLIVVQRARIWYPETGVAAYLLPLHLLLEVESGRRYRLTAPPYPFLVQPAR